MEDSVKLTDTQRRLLAAASQRDDGALKRPSQLTGGSAGKVVAKLLAEGLVEEIQSRGRLPVWRRDGDNAHTLRITRRGRQAIRTADEATAADELPKKPPARSAKTRAPSQPRAGSKQANVIAMLSRSQGATIAAGDARPAEIVIMTAVGIPALSGRGRRRQSFRSASRTRSSSGRAGQSARRW
jgi:hypothetical protein